MEKMIKKYEPMMHNLIRRYKIKKDHEDVLQILRIKTWKVLRDKRYKKIYRDKNGKIVEAKLSTWLYKVLSLKLQDLLKVEYGLKTKEGEKITDLGINKQTNYFLKNPILIGANYIPIETYDYKHILRSKLDFELYYSKLEERNKKLLKLMIEKNGNKKEIAKELKCTARTVNRNLRKLRANYKKYLIDGGYNG